MTIKEEIEKLEKETEYKKVIKVKDYLGIKGHNIYGVQYIDNEITNGWILDDGDIYTIKELIEQEGYEVEAITPIQIEEHTKQEDVEIIEGMLKDNAICQRCGEEVIERLEKQ